MLFILFLLFFLPSNAVLLLLLKFNLSKKLGDFITLLFSYGTGPMLVSFEFYCLINLFPEKSDLFYASIIFGLFLIPLVVFCKKAREASLLYKYIAIKLLDKIKASSGKVIFFGGIILIFLTIYSTQALFFPIVDNDNVLYTNQAKAFYKFKNVEWRNESSVIINNNDKYSYNSSIQPALPMFLAASFLLGKDVNNYFPLQFLYFHYFILLLIVFLYLIYFINKERHSIRPVYYGMVFFVFSSGLSRVLMYNAKESVIYFFGIFSLLLALKLLQSRTQEQSFLWGIFLGLILGLNSFVNFHGVAIEFILLLTMLLFLKNTWTKKIFNVLAIFSTSLLFGYGQFVFVWKFSVATLANILSTFFEHLKLLGKKYEISSNIVGVSNGNEKLSVPDVSYKKLYQVGSPRDIYLKGKLQILTNVGYFGFYFWFFIGASINKYKKMMGDDKLKVISTFIGLYFLIMMDPFNLNSTGYSIILWGSSKYAGFLMILAMIPLSIYTEDMINCIAQFLKKFGFFCFPILIIFSILTLLSLNEASLFFAKILFSITRIYKEPSFYEDVVKKFLLLEISILFILSIAGLAMKIKNINKLGPLIGIALFFLFILCPFFATSVGKVPLSKTFYFIGADKQTKLENSMYEGAIFKSYSYAKSILPKNTALATGFNEIYAYNDYFNLINSNYSNDAAYEMASECGEWKILYQENKIKLCSKY